MATNSPKKTERVKPKSYSICLLYNTIEAHKKLSGISLASCNSSGKSKTQTFENPEGEDVLLPDLQLAVSDKMSCNFCDAAFDHRLEQKRHYRSDWHRYNLKQRLKGKDKTTEEQFEDISGNISSLSGSDADSEGDTDMEQETRQGSAKRLPGSPRRLTHSGNSSTDSESESGNKTEDIARRLPKVYFKNKDGEMLSIYRCVLCHKKSRASPHEDLVTMATNVPEQMNWTVFMAAGGHFAGAIFNKNQMVVHKTFHRYVVRAKRGTAQGSRDSQGNAPKSAGASLRRYNEAALIQEVQDMISSWNEHIQQCDRIFLRAPSFNRKIFFSGKAPPFSKDDARIRLIPFQTRRPTFNEVRRVYEMLAAIECYGDEADIQDLVPISPPQVFNSETGQLTPRDESQLSPRQRRILNRKLGTSPLAMEENKASCDSANKSSGDKDDAKIGDDVEQRGSNSALPGHVWEEGNISSGTSTTASDTELVETMTTINLMELKEFACTRKPKKKKKTAKKRKNSLKCQIEPETNVMEEEKYHLKNSLYTACKVGDKEALKNLLAVLCTPQINLDIVPGQSVIGEGHQDPESMDEGQGLHDGQDEVLPNESVSAKQNGENVIKSEKTGTSSQDANVEYQTDKSSVTVKHQCRHTSGDEDQELTIDEKCRTESNSSSKHKATENCTIKPETTENTTNKPETIENINNKPDLTENSTNKPETIEDSTNKVDLIETSINNTCDTLADKPERDKVPGDEVRIGPNVTAAENDSKCQVDPKLEEEKYEDAFVEESYQTNREVNICDENPNVLHSEICSLHLVINSSEPSVMGMWPDFSPVSPGLLTEPFGDNNTTLLHVAAREGHGAVVAMLMDYGASPAVRDKGGLTPYMVSKDKASRNEFRRFMGKWPERYDYEKAQIPGPLTDEMEEERKKKDAERKKAQRKVKQEQQKERRETEEKDRAEQREKQRFLKLSDRDKRAIAADRRLVSQLSSQGAGTPVLSRCFQCARDMTGKVPFEYRDYKFCASKCLQQHRKSQSKT